MSDDCLFCKMLAGDIPADIVYQDDDCLAFRDINPQAPTHILVIPRKHIARIDEAAEEDAELLGRCVAAAGRIAKDEGLSDGGFRVVANAGEGAGQTVFHIHFHILGGRSFSWPPG